MLNEPLWIIPLTNEKAEEYARATRIDEAFPVHAANYKFFSHSRRRDSSSIVYRGPQGLSSEHRTKCDQGRNDSTRWSKLETFLTRVLSKLPAFSKLNKTILAFLAEWNFSVIQDVTS